MNTKSYLLASVAMFAAPDMGAAMAGEAADVDVVYYKTIFRQSQKRKTTLSNEAIVEMVLAADDDKDDADWVADMIERESPDGGDVDESEPETPPNKIAAATLVQSVAAALSQSEDVVHTVGANWAATKIVKRSPFMLKFEIEGALSDQILAQLPVPGTGMEGKAPRPVGNAMADKYVKIVIDGGTRRKIRGSTYADIYALTTFGKPVEADYVAINKATGKSDDRLANLPKHFPRDTAGLSALKKDITSQRTADLSLLRKAISLYQREEAFRTVGASVPGEKGQEDATGSVTFGFRYTSRPKAGNPKVRELVPDATAPYVVFDTVEPTNCVALSVGQFLLLDPVAASQMEGHGTYLELLGTSDRDQDENVDETPLDGETIFGSLALEAGFFERATASKAIRTQFENGLKNAHNLLTVGAVYYALEAQFSKPSISQRYDQLCELVKENKTPEEIEAENEVLLKRTNSQDGKKKAA